MEHASVSSIIALDHFIQAARDSGYKGTAAAVAELIDNAFEANANCVGVDFIKIDDEQLSVVICDDGCGMTPSVLRLALQFGGSTRFNSRSGVGRYGMGLPNSSLSRARRVDVFTWKSPGIVWWSYLDVDEIIAGRLSEVPKPMRLKRPYPDEVNGSESGTVVIWSKCDHLDCKTERALAAKLRKTLGRLFRFPLWAGRTIKINGEPVLPFDPLFLRKGDNPDGAVPYGPPLKFVIRYPKAEGVYGQSTITVTFSLLPMKQWYKYSNETKREMGVTKGVGVSIVRAGREIDYGWFFMGTKRKENYDDWWRCEIKFNPELDDWFGVTNTKQGIYPTEQLKAILSADLERAAHDLNKKVRMIFMSLKSEFHCSTGRRQAEEKDHLLEPPKQALAAVNGSNENGLSHLPGPTKSKKAIISGLAYRIEHKAMEGSSFFIPLISPRELVVMLNEGHPFYERIYAPIVNSTSQEAKVVTQFLELLLLAAARAECRIFGTAKQNLAQSLREDWGKTLATFLE